MGTRRKILLNLSVNPRLQSTDLKIERKIEIFFTSKYVLDQLVTRCHVLREKLKGTGQHLLSRTPEQENVPEGKHKRKRRRRSRWLQANSETPAEANSGSKPSENVSKPRSKAKPDFENGSKEDYVEPEVDVQPQFDDDMLQSVISFS
eukprot:1273598-Amorphochlora_amoeboformis.AAC.1